MTHIYKSSLGSSTIFKKKRGSQTTEFESHSVREWRGIGARVNHNHLAQSKDRNNSSVVQLQRYGANGASPRRREIQAGEDLGNVWVEAARGLWTRFGQSWL